MSDGGGHRNVYSTDALAGRILPSGLAPSGMRAPVTPQSLCRHLERLEPPLLRSESAVDGEHVAAMLEWDVIRLLTDSADGRLPAPVPAVPTVPSVAGRCRCSSLREVAVCGVHLSGSRREGVSAGNSDNDFMLELGPFCIVEAKNTKRFPSEQNTLLFEQTEHPAFYRLWHLPQPKCAHEMPIPFDQSAVRSLISALSNAMRSHNTEFRTGKSSGPSQEARGFIYLDDGFSTVDPGVDLVACVRLPAPLHSDFAGRLRASGQPTPQLVSKLAELPPYLVPVGFPGSRDALSQWRISFSQHEYNIIVNMQWTQRSCLRILKQCKAVLRTGVTPLKSYYLKTAVMWLCEKRPIAEWTWNNMYDCLQQVLQWTADCVRRHNLPCYFDNRINLLAPRSDTDICELQHALETMQTRLIPAVTCIFFSALDIPRNKLPAELNNFLNTSGGALSAEKMARLIKLAWCHVWCRWTLEQTRYGGMPLPPPARPDRIQVADGGVRTDLSAERPPRDNGNSRWRV